MKVIRLAGLIAFAQGAFLVILFSFWYSVAHAESVIAGPSFETSTISGSNIQWSGITGCVESGTHSAFISGFYFNNATTSISGGHSFNSSGHCAGNISGTFNNSSANWMSVVADNASTTGYYNIYFASPRSSVDINDDGQPPFLMEYAVKYIQFYFDGFSAVPTMPPPENGQGAFNVLLPNTNANDSIATTTATNSVSFRADYFVSSSSWAYAALTASSTRYILNLDRYDIASSSQYSFAAGPGETWNTITTTLTLPTGSVWRYYWSALTPTNPYYPVFPNGSLQSGTYSFSVVNNSILTGLGIAGLDDTTGLAVGTTTSAAPCGITNLSGCFQNALVYLFYPSTASLSQFSGLWTLVENKPPFGYVVAVQSYLGAFSASTTPTFSLGTIPFMDAVFDPIRSGISILMWLVFAVSFYHRLSTLDI